MALHLTPEMVEATYELLRATRPFRGWKLPEADDVVFHIINSDSFSGDYLPTKNGHRIRVNAKWCGTLEKLTRIMAHEMVHLHLAIACPTDVAHHGHRFNKAAAIVCRHHNFDPKGF